MRRLRMGMRGINWMRVRGISLEMQKVWLEMRKIWGIRKINEDTGNQDGNLSIAVEMIKNLNGNKKFKFKLK